MLTTEKPSTKIPTAVARLEVLSLDERARMLHDSRMMTEWDIRADKEEAIKEAVKEAVSDRDITIIRNALSKNISFEDIAEITGLPIEKIKELSN